MESGAEAGGVTTLTVLPDEVRDQLRKAGGAFGEHVEALMAGKTIFVDGWGGQGREANAIRAALSRRRHRLVIRTREVDGTKGLVMWAEPLESAA